MFSLVNPFGGLSAANILTLFSTISSSSSATSDHPSQPASSDAATGSAAAIKEIVAQANASDPAKAIKTILAQAQVDQAQNAASDDGEPTQAEIAKEAHDDEYGIGVETFSFAEATSLSTLQANLSTQPGTADAQPETAPVSSTDGTVSLAGTGALFSSLHAVSQAYNVGRADAASLAVITPNDVVSITDGNETEASMTYWQEGPLEAYQFQSATAQQEEAYYSAASAASGPSTVAAPDATSDSSATLEDGQSYLRLLISVLHMPFSDSAINESIDSTARQLKAAFENGTFGSPSDVGSGFSYSANFGTDAGVSIVGTVVSGSDHLDGAFVTSGTDSVAAFQDLANESAESEGRFDFAITNAPNEYAAFLIPIANS